MKFASRSCSGKLIFPIIMLGIAQISAAQSPVTTTTSSSTTLSRQVANREAFSFFKQGDSSAGLTVLSSALQTGVNARHRELQIASSLSVMSFWFKNEGDNTRAVQLAGLGISVANSSLPQMSSRDAANASIVVGGLYEHIIGDRARAKQSYLAALAVDPSRRRASERLTRLEAIDARATEKAAGDALIRARVKPGK